MFNKGQGSDATVSPEEILSARKLDGEVGRFTLRHESSPRYAWDLLIMVMILIDVILTPLSLGFKYSPHFLDGLNTLGTVLFVIDFVVHIFSSYTDDRGVLISGPKRTALNYLLSGWAVPDFLSWFPFEALASSNQGRVLSFTKIFRLAKVSQLARKFNSAKKAGILRFILLLDSLAKRIRGYYENLWRETKSISSDADAFINELSPALICEVKFQLYRDMIKRIPFLSANTLSSAVIEMLILHLRTVIYMQDDILIRKGEFGDWMGFIGSKGSVGVLDPTTDTRKIIRILRKGDYFGEMALLQRAKRSTTAVALTWVQIHVLCRNDLDSVKEQYPTQTEILESEINKYMQSKVQYK
ncbi:hypothetical protein JM16_006092 [Phytophthora kernoviae]|uniref:Cyclic nucleotide-binding domain-containing protein n=1 Tax=Phytophthora kernoviae TaxID=325452 RepID=A0A8T0LWH0_9STRA|nr:hypothetical protein JM16_006092 [Phytophthora kernoviae]